MALTSSKRVPVLPCVYPCTTRGRVIIIRTLLKRTISTVGRRTCDETHPCWGVAIRTPEVPWARVAWLCSDHSGCWDPSAITENELYAQESSTAHRFCAAASALFPCFSAPSARHSSNPDSPGVLKRVSSCTGAQSQIFCQILSFRGRLKLFKGALQSTHLYAGKGTMLKGVRLEVRFDCRTVRVNVLFLQSLKFSRFLVRAPYFQP